jgi:hypothetical protein
LPKLLPYRRLKKFAIFAAVGSLESVGKQQLRQYATPLCAMRGQRSGNKEREKNTIEKFYRNLTGFLLLCRTMKRINRAVTIFAMFLAVFTHRTLSVWSCSLRSHHHEIFFRQKQAQAPAFALPQKNSPSRQKSRQPFGSGCFLKNYSYLYELKNKLYLCRNF